MFIDKSQCLSEVEGLTVLSIGKMQAITPVMKPKETVRIIEDGCSVRSVADRESIYITIRLTTDPINDPTRLPMADSISSDMVIGTLLAPNAIKMRTLSALRRIPFPITSDMANTNEMNVIDTAIDLIIPVVSQTRILRLTTAAAATTTTLARLNLLLLRPFMVNQARVIR